jgi:hypothetical protein
MSSWKVDEAICPAGIHQAYQLSRYPGFLQRLSLQGPMYTHRAGSYDKLLLQTKVGRRSKGTIIEYQRTRTSITAKVSAEGVFAWAKELHGLKRTRFMYEQIESTDTGLTNCGGNKR